MSSGVTVEFEHLNISVVHSFFKRSSISTEFTFDVNGDIVSTSSMDKSTSRKRERLESTTTPR
jgi:hypothetical protein